MKRELVSFIIPFLPVSCNSLYGIKAGRGGVKVFLKSEARTFKEKAKLFMPPRSLDSSSLLSLEIFIKAAWFFKNGSVRKLDIQNLEKILIDAIAEKYDFEDQRIWMKLCEKQEGVEEQVLVKISILEKEIPHEKTVSSTHDVGDASGDKLEDAILAQEEESVATE